MIDKGLNVLVIEDHADTAASLATVLRLAGHQVATARDGASGMKAAQARWPDVVLLDLGLPGSLDGYDVAHWLRQQTGLHRAVIIAVTGYDQAAERKRSYETGIDFHFTKPADPSVLVDILERLQHLNQ
jgi:DNA-binding response OmpR family regulator